MNLLFLGSSPFSVPFLDYLYCSTHNIPLVITNPDAPAGRGKKMRPNPVKVKALELGIRVMEINGIDKQVIRSLSMEELDAAVVVSFGIILPEEFLNIFSGLCINVHPSLLPKYRGPTPISSALENGDQITGVSIMKMSPRMDAGPLFSQIKIAVMPEDNLGSLKDKMIKMGRDLLETNLMLIEEDNMATFEQDESYATYTTLIDRKKLKINWEDPAEKIANMVRAYSPDPGCFSFYEGQRIKILKSKAIQWEDVQDFLPGNIVGTKNGQGFFVLCGKNSALSVEKLQPAGKKPISAVDFLNGYKLKVGDKFE